MLWKSCLAMTSLYEFNPTMTYWKNKQQDDKE